MLKDKEKKLLNTLQRDKLCVPQITKLAHRVHEPVSTVKDRISHLEKNKVIKDYIPVIDPEKAGQEVLVFVLANLRNLDNPDPDAKQIAKHDFVQGVYFLVGEKDILIKIRATSIQDYQKKMAKLRKYFVGGGGIVVSKTYKDTLSFPIE